MLLGNKQEMIGNALRLKQGERGKKHVSFKNQRNRDIPKVLKWICWVLHGNTIAKKIMTDILVRKIS